MDRREPTEPEEHGLRLRTDLLARLMRRLRALGFDVGVEYGGGNRPSWEPWLLVPGRAEIDCEVGAGPLFTVGPHPYEFADDIAEAIEIIHARGTRSSAGRNRTPGGSRRTGPA